MWGCSLAMLDYTTVMLASIPRKRKIIKTINSRCVSFERRRNFFMAICLHIAVATTVSKYFVDGTMGSLMDVS